jgi:hypothetical protein
VITDNGTEFRAGSFVDTLDQLRVEQPRPSARMRLSPLTACTRCERYERLRSPGALRSASQIAGEMRLEGGEAVCIGRDGPEPDHAVWANKHCATVGDTCAGGVEPFCIPCLDQVAEALQDPGDAFRIGSAEDEQVVTGAAERASVQVSLARSRSGAVFIGPLPDNGTPRVREIDHRPGSSDPGGRVSVWPGRGRPSSVDRDDRGHHTVVHEVRDLENVLVGGCSLELVALEQRRFRATAERQCELPREIVGVVEAGVQPEAGERAREVAGVSDQESAAVAEPRRNTSVHVEGPAPHDAVRPSASAETELDPVRNLGERRLGSILFEVRECDEAPVRQRGDKQEASAG